MAPKKRLRPRAKLLSEATAQLSPPQLHQLSEAFLSIAEGFGLNQADWELAMEDQGWLTFGHNQLTNELLGRKRIQMVARCRLFWRTDPLAKQAVRLWTDYGIGKGISYEAEDDDATQTKLDEFFKFRKNRKLTCSKGQQRLSKKLLIDGDIFFAVFTKGEPAVLRTIDPMQITEIISDPQDEETVLCYKRQINGSAGDIVPKTLYYRDWAADPADAAKAKDPATQQTVTLEKDVVVYHLSFDDVGKWGNGLLTPVVEWSNAHRIFMQDRVAITRGLAKFVTKLTVKGGQAALDAVKKKLASTLSVTGYLGGVEKNPATAPGSTYMQNAGIDMQATPRATGAGDAMSDGRMLKLQVCAGTGIMEHYFGDGANANLAIATAMEMPMLKQFQGYQELWMDVWQDLFAIVLDEDPDADADSEEGTKINVTLPKILVDDLLELGQYLAALTSVFPEAKVEDILRICLEALGVDDVDEVLQAAAAQRKIIDAQNLANQQAAAANAKAAAAAGNPSNPANPAGSGNGNGNGNGNKAAPEVSLSKESIAALNHFADSLKEAMAT